MECATWPVGSVSSFVDVFNLLRFIVSSSRSMTAPSFFNRLTGESGGTPGESTTV